MDPILILLLGIALVLTGILVFKLHPFFVLILTALMVAALTGTDGLTAYGVAENLSPEEIDKLANSHFSARVAEAFGVTCGKIGIVICMASIIGKCLLDSGAALRIVRALLNVGGEKRAPAALGASGFFLGIPVFFDTVFYLLVPLAKALGASTGKNYGLYVMAIIAGGTIAHSQIPPTPGPLLVAELFGIDLGTMVIGGLITGSFAVTAGMFYAYWVNRRYPLELRESDEESASLIEKWKSLENKDLPPLWLSVMPILLPLILLSGGTFMNALGIDSSGFLGSAIKLLGEKNLALTISAGIGLYLLWSANQSKLEDLKESMQAALSSGGIVLLITCGGGAFGAMLKQSGIGEAVQSLSDSVSIGILPMTFILTAVIRTVQGSASVAMFTSAAILSPMANAELLGFHPIYLAMVIGFGSKPFAWMNDSGFWIIGKMSGMTEKETFVRFSFLASGMAVVGLIICMIASAVLPLV